MSEYAILPTVVAEEIAKKLGGVPYVGAVTHLNNSGVVVGVWKRCSGKIVIQSDTSFKIDGCSATCGELRIISPEAYDYIVAWSRDKVLLCSDEESCRGSRELFNELYGSYPEPMRPEFIEETISLEDAIDSILHEVGMDYDAFKAWTAYMIGAASALLSHIDELTSIANHLLNTFGRAKPTRISLNGVEIDTESPTKSISFETPSGRFVEIRIDTSRNEVDIDATDVNVSCELPIGPNTMNFIRALADCRNEVPQDLKNDMDEGKKMIEEVLDVLNELKPYLMVDSIEKLLRVIILAKYLP